MSVDVLDRTGLCMTRPPEWWDLGNDGNRLALLLCNACPRVARCGEGDPKPHGVILAGIAWADSGVALPICWCGYPQTNYRGGTAADCPRCRVPDPVIHSDVAGCGSVKRGVKHRVVSASSAAEGGTDGNSVGSHEGGSRVEPAGAFPPRHAHAG